MSERKIIGYSAGDDGWPPKDGRSSFAEEAYGEHPGNAVRDSFHSPREQLANALTRLEKNSQPLEARPIPPLFPKQPLSGTAKYFVVGARVFAGSLMLVLWVAVVGPIWFAILLR